MDAAVLPEKVRETVDQFVTEADWIPGFWNFLLSLDSNDLIAELIQNDLDQGATRTVIVFEQNQLVCEGNGTPVESDGWQRLRKIQGAGDTVPAKRGKIGVKNHGLKTAVAIGDELKLSSDGRSIIQTLHRYGRDKPPYPGASSEPTLDPDAPAYGCRIVVKYRDRAVELREGEAIVLAAFSKQEIDELFTTACESAPEQFAGIVSPEVAPRYEIVLRHWRFGEARFEFSCTRPRKAAGGIGLFRRRCYVSGTAAPLPGGLQEEAARRLLPLKGRLKERVADFFRRGNRFFIETSWPVDGRGKPVSGVGRFRYPIGYPEGSHEARTGHGAFFNAPFVSDNKRHEPARNDATNKDLREAREALLVDALARCTVPRWGAEGLDILAPTGGEESENQAVRPLLSVLARRSSIPTINWPTALRRASVGKGLKALAATGRETRGSGEPRKYRFVAPVVSWDQKSVHGPLSVICPRSEKQLDPRIHPEVIRLLADGHTAGFGQEFITFDEEDALARASGTGNQYFAACANPEREFATPLFARSYLDVIQDAIAHEKCAPPREAALQAALLLPDTRAKAVPFRHLHASAPLPATIPALHLPPILHDRVASHPIFKRVKWRRPRYTMLKFLESGTLQGADGEVRHLFWNWLRANELHVRRPDRAKRPDLAIWPDTHGSLHTLAELYEPRSPRVAAILGDEIQRPHEQIVRSKLSTASKKRRTPIRRVPSQGEVARWLDGRMAAFVRGVVPETAVVAALDRFVADIAVLLADRDIARLLKATQVVLLALAQDGSIDRRTELVAPSKDNDRLALRPRFLLKDARRAGALDKLSPALPGPTVAMLLATFEEDPGNFAALQPRLRQFFALTEASDSYRARVAGIPILPVHGESRAPDELAFTGPRGDYWGAWKVRLPGQGLSQDEQRRYLDVGVTSASPTPDTSRAFLQWLSNQCAAVLEGHIGCVLRHILHRNGPESWAAIATDAPFIPARSRSGLHLVSLRAARNRSVYLPDAREIAEAIAANDPNVLIVIDRAREVTEPISEPLRRLGVKSLREAIGEPERVTGSGNVRAAMASFTARFHALQSPRFRRTFLKRLDELGVGPDLVWRDWYDRLSRVKTIRLADEVEASYLFRGRSYRIGADAGFDPASGTFWVKAGAGEGPSSLYEAIAAQLVFKPVARPIHLLALERAVALEIHDPSFGHAGPAAVETADSDGGEIEADGDSDGETGEAVFGHSPFHPDASRNIPKPGPIPPGIIVKPRHRGRRETAHRSDTGGGGSPAPELEKEHIEALKSQHYAGHCQMCLCERLPQELAPAGSYIEWEEVRRRVVEAHHVDVKSSGGARYAGNLILLCKLHHDNFGRRLTRAAVTAAFKGETNKKVIRFFGGAEGLAEVTGRTVDLMIPDTGEVVSLFFTEEHAAYWLSQIR